LRKFNSIFASYEPPVGAEKSPVEPIESKLSLTSTWRIEQAERHCDQSNNELIYKEYWDNSIKPENQKTVCMAEQFADQVAADGDNWIETKAGELIEQCEKQGRKEKKIYFLCLRKNLEKNASILSSPCKELGEQGLWDQQKCEHLVSYIFMKKFDKVLASSNSLLERFKFALDRMSKKTLVKFFINPVVAILVFILFVLDVVFLIEKGSWMRVTKVGLFLGPLLLFVCFLKDGIALLLSGITIIIIFLIIGWNHRKVTSKPKEKKPTPIEF